VSRESRSFVSAVATRTTPRPALNPHFIVSVARGPELSKVRSVTAACECRWNRTWPRKAQCNANSYSALDTRSETADMHPDVSRVGASTSPVLLYPAGTDVLWLRGKPHSELPGLCEMERNEGGSCNEGARSWTKERRDLCRTDRH